MIIRKVRILVSKGWYYVIYSISFLLLSAFSHIPAKAQTIKLSKENDSILFSTTEVLYGAALFGLFDDEPINPDSIYTVLEDYPCFPSGEDALYAYLKEKTKYPKACRKDSIQGRVIVSFIVETDGSISGAKIVKSVHEQLDAEALRVVSTMPKWIPGKLRGKTVRTRYNIPVTFRLDDSQR